MIRHLISMLALLALVASAQGANQVVTDASDAPEIAATLPPPDDLESAIITTLAPSNSGYTAVVRGVNGSTGEGFGRSLPAAVSRRFCACRRSLGWISLQPEAE